MKTLWRHIAPKKMVEKLLASAKYVWFRAHNYSFCENQYFFIYIVYHFVAYLSNKLIIAYKFTSFWRLCYQKRSNPANIYFFKANNKVHSHTFF